MNGTQSVLGHLLSPEFVAKSRVTGAYSPTDFQFAAPEWDALEMLPVLEALATQWTTALATGGRRSLLSEAFIVTPVPWTDLLSFTVMASLPPP